MAILLSSLRTDGRDPTLLGVIRAWRGHEQLVVLLNPQCLLIDQHIDPLASKESIRVEAKVVQPERWPRLVHGERVDNVSEFSALRGFAPLALLWSRITL